jgi:hypothetical protein
MPKIASTNTIKPPAKPVPKKQNPKRIIIRILLIVFIVLILMVVAVISGAGKVVGQVIPLPAAVIGPKVLWTNTLPLTDAAQFTKTLQIEILRQIAAKRKVYVTEQDRQAGLAELASTSGKEISFAELNFAQKQAFNELLLTNKLKTWFYGQKVLNSNAYTKVSEIQDQLSRGTSFEALADTYNQDPASAWSSGELAAIPANDIVAELRDVLTKTEPGNILVAASRNGIHLFLVLPAPEGSVKARQIFLAGGDFNVWLAQERTQIPIRIFIRPN